MITTLEVLENIVRNGPNLKDMQDFFDRNGATKMLLSIFSDRKNLTMDDQLLN